MISRMSAYLFHNNFAAVLAVDRIYDSRMSFGF